MPSLFQFMMRSRRVALLSGLSASLAIGGAGAVLAQGMPGMGGGGPAEVGVVELVTEEVPYAITLPGRAVASEQTEIRPRVGGVIEEIPYTAGSTVAVGDVLFRLEADTYEAEMIAAEATLASAIASVSSAEATVARYEKLEGVSSTASDIDTARATLAQALATQKSAEAALKTAQLNLDRVEIKSPIAGIVDVPEVSVGTLVTANQSGALATVTRLDPVYVDVAESSARMLRIRDMFESGVLVAGEEIGISLTLENGTMHAGEGRMVSPSSEVSTTTGTFDIRLEFDNPDHTILPGQFLRVEMTLGTTTAILVPQRAGTRQSDGSLTVFVARDGVAEQVTLTTSGSYGNAWVATDGVEEGDLVIVDGLRTLRNGAEITPVPVTINEAGVVEDVAGE